MAARTQQALYRPAQTEQEGPAKPVIGNLMYDARVRRGPAMSNSAAFAASLARPTPSAGAASSSSSSSSGGLLLSSSSSSSSAVRPSGTLRVNETRSSIASKIKVNPSYVALDGSARLDVTARKRGPQPFDIRAGERPREEIDLTSHIVEQVEPKKMSSAGTQLDDMLPAPAPRPYAQSKRGVDADTQVEAGTREWHPRGTAGPGTETLFNFDAEISGLLDSLTSDVLEQANVEVGHEEELVGIASRREMVQSALNQDEALAKALEAKAMAAAARKAGTVGDARTDYNRAVGAMEKVAAAAAAKEMLGRVAVPSAMAELKAAGYFFDPVAAQMVNGVMPDLLAGVAARLSQADRAAGMVDGVLNDALATGSAQYAARVKEEEEDLRRAYYIRVYVKIPRKQEDVEVNGILPPGTHVPVDSSAGGGGGGGATASSSSAVEVSDSADGLLRTIVVGPVPVSKAHTVAQVEDLIHAWLDSHPNSHTRRVTAMGGGHTAPLALFLNGTRIPESASLLSRPLESLGSLELKPRAVAGWNTDVPEEKVQRVGSAEPVVAEPSE